MDGFYNMNNAAVLVDGGYFDKVKLSFKKQPVDLIKFSDHICNPCNRFRTYYYDALPWVGKPPSKNDAERRRLKQQYLDSIRMLHRLEVRLGEVQRNIIKCNNGANHINFIQKLVDVQLSVDMVRLAWGGFVDKIVLVSGDRDFLPAVKAAKEAGVIIKLVYAKEPHAYIHTNLLMAVDERQIMDQGLIKKCKP